MHGVIDDPEFTAKAFFEDPFRWVDRAQFRRLTVGFGRDALVDVNPIEGYPNLFNGISMDGKSYLLVEITPDGHSLVLGSTSCRHLLLTNGGKLGLSMLPAHQAVMASIITISERDVTAFSPMIQVRAIIDASSKSWGTLDQKTAHDMLVTLLGRLRDSFIDTPDESRKCFIFYYMLYVAYHHKNRDKPGLFAPFFNTASSEFVYHALHRMKYFTDVHDAVRERMASLVKAAALVFPNPYHDGKFSMQINKAMVSLTDIDGFMTQSDTRLFRTKSTRTRNQVGYRKRGRKARKSKLEPPAMRIGQPVKRKARKERPNVLTGKYVQSLITNWAHGYHHHAPLGGINKCAGAVIDGKVESTMKNAQMADQFTDYLLAVSGDVGEWVAQQWEKTTSMKERRAFVKAIYKRAEQKLTAKKYGEWAMKFVTSMLKDDFLSKEAESIVSNWGVAHGAAKQVKHSVYKNLMDRLANIYVPDE